MTAHSAARPADHLQDHLQARVEQALLRLVRIKPYADPGAAFFVALAFASLYACWILGW